jgi:ribosomal-protein-alanine acetyltransferase
MRWYCCIAGVWGALIEGVKRGSSRGASRPRPREYKLAGVSRGLALEAARPSDLAGIVALERASYGHPLSEASLRDAIEQKHGYRALVLLAADGGVRAHCITQRVADELHVHKLTVAEAERRRGLARRLMSHVLEEARGEGARLALLEVRESNRAARGLYASLGFDEVGHRRGYYASPREDALLLQKTLS